MKKLIVLAASVVTVLSSVTASAQSYLSQAEKTYLNNINTQLDAENNEFRITSSDRDKLKHGRNICNGLNEEKSLQSFFDEAKQRSTNVEYSENTNKTFYRYETVVITNAVRVFCPEHQEKLSAVKL